MLPHWGFFVCTGLTGEESSTFSLGILLERIFCFLTVVRLNVLWFIEEESFDSTMGMIFITEESSTSLLRIVFLIYLIHWGRYKLRGNLLLPY